jgi:hypothetical protein
MWHTAVEGCENPWFLRMEVDTLHSLAASEELSLEDANCVSKMSTGISQGGRQIFMACTARPGPGRLLTVPRRRSASEPNHKQRSTYLHIQTHLDAGPVTLGTEELGIGALASGFRKRGGGFGRREPHELLCLHTSTDRLYTIDAKYRR